MQWYVNVEFAQIVLLMVRIYSCWEAGSLTTSRDGCWLYSFPQVLEGTPDAREHRNWLEGA